MLARAAKYKIEKETVQTVSFYWLLTKQSIVK